jgi:sugar diacid utilization regulator
LNLAQPGFVAQITLPPLARDPAWSTGQFAQRAAEALDALLHSARRVRALLGLEGIEVAIGERVVAILSLPPSTTEEHVRTEAARWAHQLMGLYRQGDGAEALPAVGLGRLAQGWAELPRSANEAERALRWALSSRRSRVVYYGDLGSERLLAAVSDRSELERFCREQLGPLLEYDEAKEGELVRTLDTYFTCGGHMARAAKELSIHPNTLKYRLDQVLHLTGRDPRDPAIALDLQLALKINAML